MLARYEPDEWGVYELTDAAKNTVYFGSGKIKTCLLEHINKRACLLAEYYRFELCETGQECKAKEMALLESFKKKYRKLPIYNQKQEQTIYEY